MRTVLLLFVTAFVTLTLNAQKFRADQLIPDSKKQKATDRSWSNWKRSSHRLTDDTLTIPVVFHILHQNGPEHISDSDVGQALINLNAAFANSGSFDQGSGSDTRIRFCLARVDPQGQASSGINHVYTDYPLIASAYDDSLIKSLIRWDTRRYLNVWVVKDVRILLEDDRCGADILVAGAYATLPGAVGSPVDGIVAEAASLAAVLPHECGHYLGLLHPFEDACSNNDCLTDGDGICDTPPQARIGVPCANSTNSCTTDTVSGFATDQSDLRFNFMDYGACPHDFTADQIERMRFVLATIRQDLVQNQACTPNCPQPARAVIGSSYRDIIAGDSLHLSSVGQGASLEWQIEGQVAGNSPQLVWTFSNQGWHRILLQARAQPDALACRNEQVQIVQVHCASRVRIDMQKLRVAIGEPISFTSQLRILRNDPSAVSLEWYAGNLLFSRQPNPTHVFQTPGSYTIYLVAIKGSCRDTSNRMQLIVREQRDLTLNLLGVVCAPTGDSIRVALCNDGISTLPAGAPIRFYISDPFAGVALPLGAVLRTSVPVGAFCCASFTLLLPADRPQLHRIFAVINDDGSLTPPYRAFDFPMTDIQERRYDNNIDSLDLSGFEVRIQPRVAETVAGTAAVFSASGTTAPASINWLPARGRYDCDTCPVVSFTPAGYATLVVQAIDSFGCTARDTALVRIRAASGVLLPNAFTPNGDGRNDLLYVLADNTVDRIDQFLIYNRWGEVVFRRDNFPPNDPAFGWDGRAHDKEGITETFVYIVTARIHGKTRTIKGTVVRLR